MQTLHTYYSLLYGTMPVETAVQHAATLGLETLVLTDINNTTAVFDFVKACKQHNIHPVAGMEARLGDLLLYTCMARNHEGLREINEFLSEHNLASKKLPEQAPAFENVFTLYPPLARAPESLGENEYLAVCPGDIHRTLYTLLQEHPHKLVARAPASLLRRDEHSLHAHLRAIDHNILLSQLTPAMLAGPNDFLQSPTTLQSLYRDCPILLHNAQKLLEQCNFDFDFKSPKNKQIFTSSRYDDRLLLEKLALEGMEYRYGRHNKKARERLLKELEVIDRLGFSSYFLITWDIIRYSMSRGMYHVGRGSGGNSIVAYCLRITDIDPIELDLYFERFINAQRTSPPDFDIDYGWTDRDHIQDYIFKRYGRHHTALLGTINTFRDKSVIREMGKVYGLPKAEIDALVKNPSSGKGDPVAEKILEYGSQILDFPNHRSIHAGGVLVSEKPIYYYTALDLPPKGFPATQWDMYVAEDIGFEKLDILSQRGIAHIQEGAELVLQNKGKKIDVHQVSAFKKDPEINQRLYNGEAIGCFYIESPAMRGLLKKLKCNDYIRLVAASSIIRPGVAKSGMMREYIKRFHNPASVQYLHPTFEEQLGETFGVMVYQEDVIKISHHFAGLGLDDSDILRRAMSGKFRSRAEFQRIRDKFFEGCRQKGHPPALAQEVWRQIESFSGYAFCKAHSASYAVESYQSLFLKTYYPDEFHVAVINNFGGFYTTRIYVNEAKRHGATIHLPCINRSVYKTSLCGRDIFLGWQHIKGLESSLAIALTHEREQNGPYKHLQDFIRRTAPGLEQVLLLIRCGALRFCGKTKKELMWEAHFLLSKQPRRQAVPAMFEPEEKQFTLPPLNDNALEDAYDEMELLGFPVSSSYFDMLQTPYRGNALAADLMGRLGQKVRMVGDLVTIKYVHTVRKDWMHFGCFLDEKGEFFDTVHFPQSLQKYPFTGQGVYLMEGKVVEEFGYPSVEVNKLGRLPFRVDGRME
ncbi:MAG: DNA polymerase III subunit alpha [Bacteroidales bacterium]